jgi:hypothetical protein
MNILETILSEWNKDSVIDDSKIQEELIRIPKLHCKYITYLSQCKEHALKLKFDYDKLRNLRSEYYLGTLDKETLEQYNWEPFQLHISTKAGIEKYLAADDYLIKVLQKKLFYEQAIDIIESILGEIKNRSWQIRSLIDYQKFLNGA